MASRFAIMAGIALVLSIPAGAALAQMDPPPANDFYGDPVLPDPPQKVDHVFSASVATQDVAAVAPEAPLTNSTAPAAPTRTAKAKTAGTSCTALNPCAITTPAARS